MGQQIVFITPTRMLNCCRGSTTVTSVLECNFHIKPSLSCDGYSEFCHWPRWQRKRIPLPMCLSQPLKMALKTWGQPEGWLGLTSPFVHAHSKKTYTDASSERMLSVWSEPKSTRGPFPYISLVTESRWHSHSELARSWESKVQMDIIPSKPRQGSLIIGASIPTFYNKYFIMSCWLAQNEIISF